MIEIKGLTCGYGERRVLEDVSFTGNSGDIICILGPNGSGKSTLIKTILGLLKPFEGEILIDNEDIKSWNWRKRANKISYIPQSFSSTFQYKVKDIVLMGRNSYLSLISFPSKKDEQIAEEAMEKLKILHLKDKIYSQLSGGERQLVKIAQALAQQSEIIIMDEPTNNLDFSNQIVMLGHLKEWIREGVTVIMATHCPEHAFLYGTKALLVKDKKVVEIDNPKENLKEKDLIELYNVDLKIIEIDSKDKASKICIPAF
ncbi:ABC transporter ATP-binding protein [Clostridium sp. Cult1]|uniref:ABC transporter ATP-binding protein n=1 Tax=Clostridium sp. Cult1 TaxID=2079002 RepID=UPI001F2A045F|nr:ABC transporter ATP-binding protein [Clostridium sp. Cult1]MCF6463138.1 iron ABC transporter ATP-binding protein [Clostridium sp. Cult1]